MDTILNRRTKRHQFILFPRITAVDFIGKILLIKILTANLKLDIN